MDMNLTVTADTSGLDNLATQTTDRLKDVLRIAAFQVEKTAKHLVPFDTGDTEGSIMPDFDDLDRLEVRIGPSTDYAPFLEFGSHGGRSKARPFMTPALENQRRAFISAITQVIEEGSRG